MLRNEEDIVMNESEMELDELALDKELEQAAQSYEVLETPEEEE